MKKSSILKNLVDGFQSRTDEVQNLLVYLDWKNVDKRLIRNLLSNGVSHIQWRYFLLKHRYKKNSIRRSWCLGKVYTYTPREYNPEKCPQNDQYWLKQGYSLEQIPDLKKEYNKRYGHSMTEEERHRQSKRLKKSEKFQKMMKDRWDNPDFRKNIAEIGRRTIEIARASPDRIKPEASHFCWQYWVRQGMTEVEAKEFVSNQSTRDLSFFVSKYGEEEGTSRFDEMRTKRSKAWKDKTDALKEEINQKRRDNAHCRLLY